MVYPDGDVAASSSTTTIRRSNAWRQGAYALTEVRCRSDERPHRHRDLRGQGDAKVIPARREYTLQVRMESISHVDVTIDGEPRRLSQTSRGHAGGWWAEDGWVFVRVSGRAATVTLRP